jgi:hypothetical protein
VVGIGVKIKEKYIRAQNMRLLPIIMGINAASAVAFCFVIQQHLILHSIRRLF